MHYALPRYALAGVVISGAAYYLYKNPSIMSSWKNSLMSFFSGAELPKSSVVTHVSPSTNFSDNSSWTVPYV